MEASSHLLLKAREEHRLERKVLKEEIASEQKAYKECCEETEEAQLITGRLELKRQRLTSENEVLVKKLKQSEALVAELIKKEPKDKGKAKELRE